MADPFWEPIFTRLIDDREVIADMIRDTPDPVLIGLARKNPALWRVCNALVKGKTITGRERFQTVLEEFAGREQVLRKVIFYEWVNANPRTLEFPTIPITGETLSRLESGEFGTPLKIAILARIDPRGSAKPVFDVYLSTYNQPAAAPGAQAASDGPPANQEPDAALLELRDEAKALRRKLKETEEREASLHAKLSEKGERAATLEKLLAGEQTKSASLEVRIEALTAELAKRAEAAPSGKDISEDTPSVSELMDRVARLEASCRELETTLARRTASTERLENELDEKRRTHADSEALSRQLERLREERARYLKLIETHGRALPARLMLTGPAPGNPEEKVWIAEAPGYGRIIFPESLLRPASCVEGEWAMLERDENGTVFQARPLEDGWKREVLGVLRSDDFGWSVHSEDRSEILPLPHAFPGFASGDVVSAIVLPEFADRKSIAVPVKRLSAPPSPVPGATSEFKAGFVTIQRRLGLLGMELSEFTRWLKQQEVPFVLESDAIRFEQPCFPLLAALRPRLPMVPVCERDACRERLPAFPFPRPAQPDEICSVCREEAEIGKPVEATAGSYDFGGRRVLIVGGDAVGPAYREKLAHHNLDVEWISGFVGLGGARQGIGDVSAVVIVLKQVSHTMLREITAAARDAKVPLLYSSRRGTSGVLASLAAYFRIQPNQA